MEMSDHNDAAPGAPEGPAQGRRDCVIACILAGFGAVLWWDSNAIAAAEAQMYPRLVLVALFGLAGLLFVRGLRMDRAHLGLPIVLEVRPFAAFLALTVVYAVAVAYAGFFTSSAVYVPLAAWLIGLRRPWLNAAVSAVFLVATWLVFVALFARPLPPEMFWN